MRKNLVGAADLGSTQFVVLAAVLSGSSWELVGTGRARARGYDNGRLTDIAAAAQALGAALREAELVAGGKIERMISGLSGFHLSGEDKQVAVRIQTGTVAAEDIERAHETLRAFPIPQGMEILHIIRQFYSVDRQPGIRDPLGMTGSLLEAGAHVICAGANALADLSACLSKAGARHERSAAAVIASAMSATTADERRMGVAVLDWGGGICDIAVYKDDALFGVSSELVGGAKIDMDIAKTFRIPIDEAERIKRDIGSAVQVPDSAEHVMQVLDVTGEGTMQINAHLLSMAIESRVEEMLGILRKTLEDFTVAGELSAGVVLCGGNVLLTGLLKLAHDVLKMPVRLGYPRYSGPSHEDIATPEYTAAAGLLDMHSESLRGDETLAQNGYLARLCQKLGIGRTGN